MDFIWSEKPENILFEIELHKMIATEGLVLDVGCGDQKLAPSLLGVDAYDASANIQAYMWEMPFDDESVDGLVCIQALEHVSKFHVMPTLAEFQRVLKVGATAIILVPDFEWVLTEFLKNPNVQWELDTIFGTQTHEGQFHKTGFTKDFLDLYLREGAPRLKETQYHHVNAYSQMNHGLILVKE